MAERTGSFEVVEYRVVTAAALDEAMGILPSGRRERFPFRWTGGAV